VRCMIDSDPDRVFESFLQSKLRTLWKEEMIVALLVFISSGWFLLMSIGFLVIVGKGMIDKSIRRHSRPSPIL